MPSIVHARRCRHCICRQRSLLLLAPARRPEDPYDFSRGERGKFYRKDAEIQLPAYLETDVLRYLQARAKDKNVDLNDLVNQLLKQDIALIEAVK